MQLRLLETRLGLRNSTTRLPFRYGAACLTKCPQAILQATIEAAGKTSVGYSGDCLPPGWFDKSPEKSYAQQIDDMLAAVKLAERIFAEEYTAAAPFFSGWLAAGERIQSEARQARFTPLLASFGASLVERAMIDAALRAAGVSFFQGVQDNLFALRPSEVYPELADRQPSEWLPPQPRTTVYVRHTVGLSDPLTTAEIPPEERLDDGKPQSLEEYIAQTGVRYLKIKVSNQLDHDLERLRTMAQLIERYRGDDYGVTLDGNEQYKTAEQFDGLIDAIRSAPELDRLWNNLLAIEQPLDRRVALDPAHTAGIRELSAHKPVIIDESDGLLRDYARAIELGYRGVSSKCCKGVVKSLLNAGLTWQRNGHGARRDYLMTGEDLCTVGIVPVQSDLCLAAALGLVHVERNGHHYHPGISYLPDAQRRAALETHSDFYHQQHGVIGPRLTDGQFHIGSLQCVGFGFAVAPDLSDYTAAEEWEFASLGLDA